MSQGRVNLPSLQASSMWTDDDDPQTESAMENTVKTNAYPLKTMNKSVAEETANQTPLWHIMDPRFVQLLGRRSAKVSPYGNNADMARQHNETYSPPRSLSSDRFMNNIPSTFNRTSCQVVKKSAQASLTAKVITEEAQSSEQKRRFQRMPCIYMLICALCIALIVVPLALLFGLPAKSATIEVTSATSRTTVTFITITSSTTKTTETMSTTITTAPPFVKIIHPGDPIIGLYNTTAGRDIGGFNGKYSANGEIPSDAIDGQTNTKYLNFGATGGLLLTVYQPGIGTGFYVTPTSSNASIARALLFATANDVPDRDPLTVTLEGTNATTTAALRLGSSWTLIYNGSTGISPITAPSRSTYCIQQNFSNTVAFSSYRLLITSQRSDSDSTQYSEVQVLDYI